MDDKNYGDKNLVRKIVLSPVVTSQASDVIMGCVMASIQ